MSLGARTQALNWLAVAALVLAACSTATPTVAVPVEATIDPAVAIATADALAERQAQAEQTQAAADRAADRAATLAAQPTDTNTPPPTATATTVPTEKPTRTPRPTATPVPPTATATATQPPAATQPPVTLPPATVAATEPPAAPASIYSEGGGPAGFYTAIRCNRGGEPCTPVMPPSDLNFDMALGSDYESPWGLFLPYGLAVERDGVNVADMFMFVDAGWLEPGSIVWFGASRNFTVPGRYVIRSSGCFTVSDAPCGWANFAGDVITFVIQP